MTMHHGIAYKSSDPRRDILLTSRIVDIKSNQRMSYKAWLLPCVDTRDGRLTDS